ncbi:MAG: hypothetical protein G01um101448_154 [Parcubacteria group bacterium Gr01-1014_48]|nr:MAG: hypothetical protein Greene041614_109 [Parcubacteria group bacterium Greene0416_14]TSC74427.1 MAG: hypothetical protein G01um101448_154 [Parcubacteria group bacterium Gr01-1014_48]TSD01280.1 MAG: hypothetical protein Greene101415_369 [Parcubacteria group bacterium Greene1014_15]TSD08399.1 MAG: hypothetical protein Greene07144_115 [Parcubacteria group bacterium Greene0714_4]
MRFTREVTGFSREPEVVDGVGAIVLLMHNARGSNCVIAGPEECVHRLFLEGALRWPSIMPWNEETRAGITDLLRPLMSEDKRPGAVVSNALLIGAYHDAECTEHVRFRIEDGICGLPATMEIGKIYDALTMLSVGEKTFVAADGWGSEKTELMLYGAAILFGTEVAKELRTIVHGVRELTLPSGEEVFVDASAMMRQIVQTFRANKTEAGEVALTPETWMLLGERQAQNGKATPSNN